MVQLEAKGEHMNQATLQQCTDFHAAPDRGEHRTGAALLLQPGLDFLMGLAAVVIRHRKMLEPPLGGLLNQSQRFEAAVAADGMAVKVVRGGAARRSHLYLIHFLFCTIFLQKYLDVMF